MSYRIVSTHRFEKELKRLVKKFPSLKIEFSSLIEDISEKSETGTFIGNNCYKIRMAVASKGKGKRGGVRVITYLYLAGQTVYLLTIYDKGDKTDLKPKELTELIESLELN
jgi:mRNA-degrading endonuclease RelE of RelBE toxin-antitoxin system